MAGHDPQAYALFLASFALSLFSAIALFSVSRTSPAFKGTKWLAAAYLAGAMASGLRMFPGAIPDSWFLYASNTLVLSVYLLLHCALLRVLEPGGDAPRIAVAALVVQAVAGPFLVHGVHAYQWRVALIAFLLVATFDPHLLCRAEAGTAAPRPAAERRHAGGNRFHGGGPYHQHVLQSGARPDRERPQRSAQCGRARTGRRRQHGRHHRLRDRHSAQLSVDDG